MIIQLKNPTPPPPRNLRCSCCGTVEMEVTLKLFCRGTKRERRLHNYSFLSPALPASSPQNWGPLQGWSGHNGSGEYVLLLHWQPRGYQLAAGDTAVCPAPALNCPAPFPSRAKVGGRDWSQQCHQSKSYWKYHPPRSPWSRHEEWPSW